MRTRAQRLEPATAGPLLITGGAGFVGVNLADRLAGEGYRVRILDALVRPGAESNLAWLEARHRGQIESIVARVEDADAVAAALRGVAVVFHLAAQVAVTTSLEAPLADFETNLRGTLVLLEAVRRQQRDVPFLFASTNKVYGDLAGVSLAIDEGRWQPTNPTLRRNGVAVGAPLALHTPYGCSKGAADQYVLDYARCFGLPATALRKSCIYGRRQLGTEDQGWVAHFARALLEGRPITVYGDGRQVRDVLDVSDCVDAYLAAWRWIDRVAGLPLMVGGGPANAVSVAEVIEALATIVGRRPEVVRAGWREADQRWYVSDIRDTQRLLGLGAPRPWRDGLVCLVDDVRERLREAGAGRSPDAMLEGARP